MSQSTAEYHVENIVAAQQSIEAMLESAQAVIREAAKITQTLQGANLLSVEDRWVKSHGELMTKKDAAAALGIGVTYLKTLIKNEHIQEAPDGRVLTRSACSWANGKTREAKPKDKKWRITP